MLGRLQMKPSEAMEQYDKVGEAVFKHPRRYTKYGIPATRFNSNDMEAVLQNITQDEWLDPSRSADDAVGSMKKKARRDVRRKAEKVQLRNGNPDTART